MKKILVLGLLLVGSVAFAANWVAVTPKSYIEKSLITFTSDDNGNANRYVTLWYKILNYDVNKDLLQNGKKWHSEKYYSSFDCLYVMSKTYQVITYDVNGYPINDSGYIDDDWRPVVPDTREYKIFEYVCKNFNT